MFKTLLTLTLVLMTSLAHAERIRCIRAPCPPDTAIVVEVGAGATTSGVDLSLGEALPPAT